MMRLTQLAVLSLAFTLCGCGDPPAPPDDVVTETPEIEIGSGNGGDDDASTTGPYIPSDSNGPFIPPETTPTEDGTGTSEGSAAKKD